ncbi:MAG: MFS transporter [Candidatus Korobacteraceae bacterium]
MSYGIAHALRALGHRNYKLFFSGQSVSLIGTWMTRIATSWLVYRLTHSPVLLGIVSFAGQVPTFIFAPFAGVWVDRLNRHRVLVITQTLAMLQSFGLAVLALLHIINVWEILVLQAFQGLINAFDTPARQAFVIQMVEEKEDLSSAIALNSSMVNMARLIGPSVAGIVIAAVGEGYCFLIDGFSYLAVIASLLAMTVVPQQLESRKQSALQQLREGWTYVSQFTPIRWVLMLLALMSLMGMPYTVLMPIFAGSILHGGAHTLGFLMGISGIGALIGAFSLAIRKTVLGLGKIIPIAAGSFGVTLIAFANSRNLWLSMALMLPVGFGMMTQMASSNTILQTIVEDDKRGRVMSYYTMAVMGMAPFGSLMAGLIAARIGAPATLTITGLCCVCGALMFTVKLPEIRRLVRPIYVGLGIIPEIATGLQDASALQTPPED